MSFDAERADKAERFGEALFAAATDFNPRYAAFDDFLAKAGCHGVAFFAALADGIGLEGNVVRGEDIGEWTNLFRCNGVNGWRTRPEIALMPERCSESICVSNDEAIVRAARSGIFQRVLLFGNLNELFGAPWLVGDLCTAFGVFAAIFGDVRRVQRLGHHERKRGCAGAFSARHHDTTTEFGAQRSGQ